MRTRLLLGALAIGFAGALAACDIGEGMTSTITLDEANRRLDTYIEQALAQLPPGAGLKERLRIEEESCDDVAGDQGKQHASRNYQVTGIDGDQIPSYFDTLREWWLQNGFRILDDEETYEYLWVENTTDGFRMTLTAASEKRLMLTSASPCVWRNGEPE